MFVCRVELSRSIEIKDRNEELQYRGQGEAEGLAVEGLIKR